MIEDASGNRRFFGVYRGTITNTSDPNKQRRVKLTVPQVLGEEPTDWAWPTDSTAVKANPPKVGQGVWVSFEGGDPSFPVWSGTFGKYKGKGYQVLIPEAPKGSYPATITRNIKDGHLDLTGAVLDIAKKVEEIRQSLNAHGGGPAEAPPTDVSP